MYRKRRSTPRPVHIRNTETYGALCGAGEKGDRWHLLKFPDSAVKRPVSCQACLRLAKKTPVPPFKPLPPFPREIGGDYGANYNISDFDDGGS